MNDMQQIIKEMLALKNWAVVGAHADNMKYGNKVFKKHLSENRNVYLVNPKYQEIDGIKVYASLADIDEPVDCISMVVNKNLARAAVEQAIEKGIKYIWFQPNTYDAELIKFSEENGIKAVYGTCVLMH